MNKLILVLVSTVVLASGVEAVDLNPYGKMVDATTFRLCQAALSKEDSVSASITRAKKCWIEHRFEKPSAIKLKRLGEQGLTVKLLFANGGYQIFHVDGNFYRGREIPLLSDLVGDMVGDVVYPTSAKSFDTFYLRGKKLLLEKFFRQNMTEGQRKLACQQTLAHDLGQPEWSLVASEPTINYSYALADVRSMLGTFPWFNQVDRWYDWREFPMSIQGKISNAVELYWKANQWQFLAEVATQTR